MEYRPVDNAFTVDLEDYFQVNAFSGVIKFKDWSRYECRVEQNAHKLLEILAGLGIRGTFFVLGWIAERHRDLIKSIAAQGQEIASHGYCHKLVTDQSPDEFRADVAKTKRNLEDITGREVIGYRAPTYSITKKTAWALKILAEEGYKYDSSIFPIYHDVYGFPEAPRFPFRIDFDGHFTQPRHFDFNSIWEFPVSTVRLFGYNLPVAGGGYFRLFPYWFIKRALRYINKYEQKPFVFYVHPWELDPEQPRIDGLPLRSRFRHYLNLDKVECRCRELLKDFRFVPLRDLMARMKEPVVSCYQPFE